MVRLTVPAQSARPGPPLGSILGQAGVRPAEFIGEFNRATIDWALGVPVGVRLIGRPPRMQVGQPAWSALVGGRSGRLDPSTLWAALVVRGQAHPSGARSVLGTLRSGRIRLE